jgi:microcin C transport system substrate-binding protein
MRRCTILSILLTMLLAVVSGCSYSEPNNQPESGSTSTTAAGRNVSIDKADYPVLPNADSGADPNVPAELGGKGFTGEGWETNNDFELQGDPHAVKGGMLRDQMPDFPGTLRIEGPESNSQFNYSITALVYETLLGLDTYTLSFIPNLATHWQISPDKMTYRFRINPNARFSDGMPVTAEDVVATYDFMMDKTLQAPSNQQTFGKLERPVAESKYIVRVKAKSLNWRNFLYFSGMAILPAHVLRTINGEKYLKEYNYKLLPGSGAYTIREQDLNKGSSITVRRRTDHWAEKARANVGTYNFDQLRFDVVRDENLGFEKFKKGELDYFVTRPKQWVEETNFDAVQRGLVQKRKVFNSEPKGIIGVAFNMRRPPFDDIRVRKALTLLINRKQIIEKLAYNEYVPQNSYYSASPYENPTNPQNPYDPQTAIKLLAEAGWKDRDSQGRLVKNGQPLQIELLYYTMAYEPYMTVYQEDLRKVGITLNLRYVTGETQFQMINERRFEMTLMAWGALLFPNPETSYHSSLADVDNTNNITGFKDARVDEICKQYDTMFNIQDRIRAIQEIDGILANTYSYALLWYSPYTRLLYWNKFGTPPGHFSRFGDYFGSIPVLWWSEADNQSKLQQALRDRSIRFDVGPLEDRYWLQVAQKQNGTQPKSD